MIKDIYQALLARCGLPCTSADADQGVLRVFDAMVGSAIHHWLTSDATEPRSLVAVARRIAIEAESDKEAGSQLSRFFIDQTDTEINFARPESLDSLWVIVARQSMHFIDWTSVARHYRQKINPPVALHVVGN